MFSYTTERVPFPEYRENQLKPELLGFSALNPFAGYNSSPRASMFSKHVGQSLVIEGSEPRRIQTGVEREFAKYTFNLGFDNNSYIVKVIDKFPYTMGKNSIKRSPMKAVIFENHDHPDLEVDIAYLPEFKCDHHFFGFDYKFNKSVLEKLKPNARIPAGTKVADSPNVQPNGDYAYGINANVILGSHPCGIEDGVMMSESFADKLTTNIYETRTFSFGDGILPLNTYGDKNNYKVFPDIGDKVRPDGVLAALREFTEELAPSDLSVKGLQDVTPFDKRYYAEPGSEVVDVTVIKGENKGELFTEMDTQVMKYHERHQQFYKEVINTYEELRKGRGGHLPISHELHRLIVEAMKLTTPKITLQKKRKKIAPWTVTITTKSKIRAANGFKITDTHGGKSVTVRIVPDSEMPVDAMGNVADLVVDDKSTIKRLIKGKLHEHYIAACMRDESTRIKQIASEYPKGKLPDEVYQELWERILGFYKIVSPPFYEKIGQIKPDVKHHVDQVIEDGLYIYLPTDNPVCYLDVARLLREYYPACYGKLQFKDFDGSVQTTHNNVLIGQIYYILLEKVANDFSAVSSAKLQHYGLPAKPSGESRYSEPIKMTPVRFGESEYRLFTATVGGLNLAEIADRSTNIQAHEEILKNLLEADQPTNVHNLIDREKYPISQGFIQKIIHHSLNTLGVKLISGEEGRYSTLK